MAKVTMLHPSEVKEGADYSDDLSCPIRASIAFPVSEDENFGEIVELQDGSYAYLPVEGTEPFIIEAPTLIQLIRGIESSIADGTLSLDDEDLSTLYSRAFIEVYK